MDQRTEPIKQDIDNIRDQMTEKIAAIEDKVKGQVNDTVETVKQAFDVKQQVGDHPWAALGISLLAGYVLGTLGDSDDSSDTRYQVDYRKYDQPRHQFASSDYGKNESNYTGGYTNAYSSHSGSSYAPSHQSAGPAQSTPASYDATSSQNKGGGFLNDLLGQFGGELDTIKTAAISSLVAMVRDSIKDALPQFGQEYERVRQQHSDAPSNTSDATLNTLLRQPVGSVAAPPTSGSRDFDNAGYSSSEAAGSAVGEQDRSLGERSVGNRSFGATETTT